MFDFTVKYFGFLKHVPLLPHLFEAMLRLQYLVWNRSVLDHIDEIENTVLSWEHTSILPHKFGGIQFNVKDREIGHIHGNGLLDVPFSKSTKEELILETDGRINDHHIFKKSGWISLRVGDDAGKELALRVLRRSYTEKRDL